MKRKINKKEIGEKNLALIMSLGYAPVQQGAPYHYKDGNVNFWPGTGKWYDGNTGRKGKIEDLPRKDALVCQTQSKRSCDKDITPPEFRYYKLDKRYLPDWVLEPKRQEWLKTIFTQKY